MSDHPDIAAPGDKDAKARAAAAVASADAEAAVVHAEGVDDEPVVDNQRVFASSAAIFIAILAGAFAAFHLITLNMSWSGVIEIPGVFSISTGISLPLETWNFRIVHVAGALSLGFLIYGGATFAKDRASESTVLRLLAYALAAPALFAFGAAISFYIDLLNGVRWNGLSKEIRFAETYYFGLPLLAATGGAIALSWFRKVERGAINAVDVVLCLCAAAVAAYLMVIYGPLAKMRLSTGTPYAPIGISFAATAGAALILEVTRRVAGLALVVIAAVFLSYVYIGDYLPGFLNYVSPGWKRFFSQVYTDAGILGPTTAVSSTYIILFIIFAAFLQASKVGDYFVNFAFAAAGRARGGPAKVAIFASGLMGMINGTSAGNVVATGSLTIPLMRRIGYPAKSAGAIEAAASTGGQIMPPIMGAGAFIMAEITGIPYLEITVAAIIPAILYFASIYFMVDFQAARLGMRGMRSDELPDLGRMLRQVYLFLPIIILIYALFAGYSVIRAGALATAAAAVVSWLTPYKMGPRGVASAFQLAGLQSIQIIAVCACAGIIVGVISITGVGARFSSLLLNLAEQSKLLALVFAMAIAILLGMGMPTTAAYAVAASVVAPGLIKLGIEPLTAHFFVFYFAVISAITPPVALASYAAAGISGANPMATSVASFKIGLAAFIVPFMFFYNSAILMDGAWYEILRAGVTALVGVFFLAAAVEGFVLGGKLNPIARLVLLVAAVLMIEGGLVTDLVGIGAAVATLALQRAAVAARA
ncbi:MAG: TRAP transporter fused permease subunit [Neomegalonema sp.]|nr:TRAP transporter fused permease subunit [Neomegalonema sp.]